MKAIFLGDFTGYLLTFRVVEKTEKCFEILVQGTCNFNVTYLVILVLKSPHGEC